MKYYGLISGLPDLHIGTSPELPIKELKRLLFQYADEGDSYLFRLFFTQLDLINLNAVIQEKKLWMQGGYLTKDDLQSWARNGKLNIPPFLDLEEQLQPRENRDPLLQIQFYWQELYNAMLRIGPPNVRKLVNYEISLKNFMKSYMERKLSDSLSEHYLEGGWFDRFAYSKLLMGDIKAEHPYLAEVLQHMDNDDPFQREEKILEARWEFFDSIAFFDAFSTSALFAWILKYLDVYKWGYNNADQGKMIMEDLESRILNQLAAKF